MSAATKWTVAAAWLLSSGCIMPRLDIRQGAVPEAGTVQPGRTTKAQLFDMLGPPDEIVTTADAPGAAMFELFARRGPPAPTHRIYHWREMGTGRGYTLALLVYVDERTRAYVRHAWVLIDERDEVVADVVLRGIDPRPPPPDGGASAREEEPR